eukprot:m.205742 g.205742  ORF g.205742 m.205742 type:complete len:128 (+) comp39661_c1_seq4:123-506(+)
MAAKDDDREALEGAKVVIGETLTEFRKSCSTMDYRRFIALVRHIGVILIRTLGGHKISFIKTGDVYANVARQTDVGQHLLCLLGFVDTTDGSRMARPFPALIIINAEKLDAIKIFHVNSCDGVRVFL